MLTFWSELLKRRKESERWRKLLLWWCSTFTAGESYPGESERSAFQERRTISKLINSFSQGVSRAAQTSLRHRCDQNNVPAAILLITPLIIYLHLTTSNLYLLLEPPLVSLFCHLAVERVYNIFTKQNTGVTIFHFRDLNHYTSRFSDSKQCFLLML